MGRAPGWRREPIDCCEQYGVRAARQVPARRCDQTEPVGDRREDVRAETKTTCSAGCTGEDEVTASATKRSTARELSALRSVLRSLPIHCSDRNTDLVAERFGSPLGGC